MRTCTVPECDRKHEARGLCKNHYKTWAGMQGKSWAKSAHVRANPDYYAGDQVNDNDLGRYYEALALDPCVYCGAPSQATDHIEPRCYVEANDWTNLAPVCEQCNAEKHRRTLLGFMLWRSYEFERQAIAAAATLVRPVLIPKREQRGGSGAHRARERTATQARAMQEAA